MTNIIAWRRMVFAIAVFFGAIVASAASRCEEVHFVPNSQAFWDDPAHWTTSYGPAYSDTITSKSDFLPCEGEYALCFHSGPEPLPCERSPDGSFANCKCTVQTGLNFVLVTAILNYEVYRLTVDYCRAHGSECTIVINSAPVCKAINSGHLIPGADIISTYSPGHLPEPPPGLPAPQTCAAGPYAGCMTASCKKTPDGFARCSCPVYSGPFQIITQPNAACSLGDNLVWSASYNPNAKEAK